MVLHKSRPFGQRNLTENRGMNQSFRMIEFHDFQVAICHFPDLIFGKLTKRK